MKAFIGIIAVLVMSTSSSGLRTNQEVLKEEGIVHLNRLIAGVRSLPALDSYTALLKYIPQLGAWNKCFVNSEWKKVASNALNFLDCTNVDEAETWQKISKDVSKHVDDLSNINITEYCSLQDFECIVKTITTQVEDVPMEVASVLQADVKCLDSKIKESLILARDAADNIADCLCKAGFPCK